jgi:dTDP-4-amino-4,6-dideoxygalactose transaminase
MMKYWYLIIQWLQQQMLQNLLELKLVLVDISEDDLCMCPNDLLKKINKNTKVVIYTEMNGRVGQINLINKICKKKNLVLIEDAAHAIGSFKKKFMLVTLV